MSAGPVVVACDLDRTLVYSRAAWQLPEGDRTELVCVEVYEGAPLSFMTARAAAALVDLAAAALLVPTTTRTREQLARIELPGPPPPFAIAANGGVLLVDGEVDGGWSRRVAAHLEATCAPLAQVRAHVETAFAAPWTLKRRVAEDLFCYAVVDRPALPEGFLDDLTGWAGQRGWRVSLQGRKVYLVPAGLTKGAAVAEVAERAGARLVLAAGDSLLDAEMLDAADAGVRPPHGELEHAGFERAHVARTARPGVLGGEDVVAWLLERSSR